MAIKLPKGVYPTGSGPDDFECFGPPATVDAEFENVKIADMGCFKQDGTDSNKFYHGAVVKHRTTGEWFVYFEWGRTGKTPTFQFVQCSSEYEAQSEFSKQLHSKNDKRGEWASIAGLHTLRAKVGKDCYLVRPQAHRETGLPDARRIVSNEGANQPIKPIKPSVTQKRDPGSLTKKSSGKKKHPTVDSETERLLRAFRIGTVQYAKTSMSTGAIPTQSAIEECRQILDAAKNRVKVVGQFADQIHDGDLVQLTSILYSRVPKVKHVGAKEETWLLTDRNIFEWEQDLNAYESALYIQDVSSKGAEEIARNPLMDMNLKMEHLSSRDPVGEFIRGWAPKATRNKHGWLGDMKVSHVWRVERLGASSGFDKCVGSIVKDRPGLKERPICQPSKRHDLSVTDQKRYSAANVGMLFHGTRSVNVFGILKEGLRLPKNLVGVVITGAMFGGGLYWADDWKKSAGYCSMKNAAYGGGGQVQGRKSFMFIADVALGQAHVASGPKGYTEPPKGCHCVFGKADTSRVANNEWIVYKTNQNQLRYLVEFDA